MRYAQYDTGSNPSRIRGWYDTDVFEYPHLDLTTVVQVPDDIWDERTDPTRIWQVLNGVVTEVQPTAPTLADRRIALAAERYAKQTAGVLFQASGATAPSLVASDGDSTAMITSSYVAATNGHWSDGMPWKMADGTFVPLTSADMQAMALKVLGYISACFAREAVLSAALATDLSTDITAGWPANT